MDWIDKTATVFFVLFFGALGIGLTMKNTASLEAFNNHDLLRCSYGGKHSTAKVMVSDKTWKLVDNYYIKGDLMIRTSSCVKQD